MFVLSFFVSVCLFVCFVPLFVCSVVSCLFVRTVLTKGSLSVFCQSENCRLFVVSVFFLVALRLRTLATHLNCCVEFEVISETLEQFVRSVTE